MEKTMKYVAYYRLSTRKQKGLGLDAQRVIVDHYTKQDGAKLVQEFTEIESGKETMNRPELLKAMRLCQAEGATLIVAKLDRLSRNVEETFKIKRQLNDHLICCDLPQTDSLTLSIFAGLAQRERELISLRTAAALQAKKARGFSLGKIENLTEEGRKKGASRMQEKAVQNDRNKRATQLIISWKKQGATLQEIADKLNANSFETVRGKEFQPATVWYLHKRSTGKEVVK